MVLVLGEDVVAAAVVLLLMLMLVLGLKVVGKRLRRRSGSNGGSLLLLSVFRGNIGFCRRSFFLSFSFVHLRRGTDVGEYPSSFLSLFFPPLDRWFSFPAHGVLLGFGERSS